jgi:tape measure domain-containing protein
MPGMSGTTRTAVIRVQFDGNDARQQLERLGENGQRSLDRVSQAARNTSPAMQAAASAADSLGQSVGGLAQRLGPLGAAMAALGPAGLAAAAGLGAAALAARQIAQIGDQFTTTMNRLQSATGSVQAATAVYGQLLALSQQTGASIAESANAFVRFSIAAREIGATNSQVVTLTRTIQQSGIIAGASAQEAAAGVLQLGQALASGKLQGDELRSILENMPTLAEALARELGVSIGQLRTMGSEGQLTSDRVFQALLRASEGINEQFDRLTPTMGRAFGILGQAMTDFVGRLDQALGLSQGIARAAQAAAGAVRGAAGFLFPDEATRAGGDVQGSLARQQALEAQIAAAAGGGIVRPGSINRGAQIAGGSAVGNAERLAELRQQLAVEQAIHAEAQERVERLRMEGNLSLEREEAQAETRRLEAQRTAATTRFNEVRTALDREAKAREDHAKRLEAIDAGLNAGATTAADAARLRALANDELAAALRRTEGAARGANDALREQERQAREQERAAREQERQGRERERAQAQAEQAQRRTLQQQEAEANRTTVSITNFFGDAFARAFESTGGGFSSLMDSFRRAAVSTFARIAAQAVIRPIIAPIVQGLSGTGLGNLLGIGGSGTSGAAGGGIGNLFSGNMLSNIGGLGGATNYLFGTSGMVAGQSLPANFGTPGLLGTYGTIGGIEAASLLGAIGGIGGGAFGIYSGIQKGGIGGAAMGLGGAAGIAAGVATLTGLGASLLPILGPAALLLPILGSLLPGQRPSTKEQGLDMDFAPGSVARTYGLSGNRFSQSNADQASTIFNSIVSQQEALAGIVGFNAAGGVDARVSNSRGDGPGRVQIRVGTSTSLTDFENTEAGLRDLAAQASQMLFEAFREAANSTSGDMASIVRNSTSMETLTANLEFFNGAYRQLADLTGLTDRWTATLREVQAPFDAAIQRAQALGLATADLARAQQAATDDALRRRDLSAAGIVAGIGAREKALAGDDLTARLQLFEIEAAGQMQQLRDALRDVGITGAEAADLLARNERLLAEERLGIQREFGERQNAAARQSLQGVIDWLNSQRLGANSSLSPFAQMQEAERQFQAAQAAGDLGGLTRSADALLTTSRTVLGGATEAFAQREMFVRQTVAQTGQRAASAAGDSTAVAALQAEIARLSAAVQEMAANMRRSNDRAVIAA